eukprot:UC1_evm1s144
MPLVTTSNVNKSRSSSSSGSVDDGGTNGSGGEQGDITRGDGGSRGHSPVSTSLSFSPSPSSSSPRWNKGSLLLDTRTNSYRKATVPDLERLFTTAATTTASGTAAAATAATAAAAAATAERVPAPLWPKVHPYDGHWRTPAQIWRQISFSWLSRLFRVGALRQLEADDLPPVSRQSESRRLADSLSREWSRRRGTDEHVAWSYIRAFRGRFALVSLLIALEMACLTAQPWFIGQTLRVISNSPSNSSSSSSSSSSFSSSSSPDSPSDSPFLSEGYGYAAGIAATSLGTMILHHLAFIRGWLMGYDLRAATIGLVYRKALRVSSEAMAGVTTGRLVNLVSNDVERFTETAIMTHFLWVAPLQLMAAAYLIWQQIGVASLAGLALMVLLVPLHPLLGRFYARFRAKTAHLTDQRVKTVKEVFTGMRVLKMYAWETPFREKVDALRQKELGWLSRSNQVRGFNMSFNMVAPPIMAFVCFATYWFQGNQLTAEKVFSTVGYINSLRISMATFFPIAVQNLSEMRSVFSRLEQFLTLPEMPAALEGQGGYSYGSDSSNRGSSDGQQVRRRATTVDETEKAVAAVAAVADGEDQEQGLEKQQQQQQQQQRGERQDQHPASTSPPLSLDSTSSAPAAPATTAGLAATATTEPAIELKACTLAWNSSGSDTGDKNESNATSAAAENTAATMPTSTVVAAPKNAAVTELNLRILPGQLLCVIGPVGCGKSTLLMSLLGELTPTRGSVRVRGKLAYAAQEPWVLSASFRDNILFGHAYDAEWYSRVVAACQLEHDLELLPDGEFTELGERGVNLSGGQKARISLARAVYSRGQVVLLDDPLSAVDARVGRALFDRCISNNSGSVLSGTTRVLVTHQIRFAERADIILALDREGNPICVGTYAEVKDKLPSLKALTREGGGDNSGNGGGGGGGGGGGEEEASETGEEEASETEEEASSAPVVHDATKVISVDTTTLVKKRPVPQKLVQDEGRRDGRLQWNVVSSYARAAAPNQLALVAWILVACGSQVCLMLGDWWLAEWVGRNVVRDQHAPDSNGDYDIGVYGGFVLAAVTLSFVRGYLFINGARRASRIVHDKAFRATLGTSVRFFETNPVGRLLNRFSKDTGLTDEVLPVTMLDFVSLSISLVGTVLLVSIVNPWVFLLTGPLVAIFVYFRRYYMKTGREIKRLEATARSPVYSHFTASLAGAATIRSHAASARFVKEMECRQDGHGQGYLAFIFTSRWLGFRLDAFTFAVVLVVAFAALATRNQLDPGLIGLSLMYSIQLTAGFQWCVRQSAELENLLTSLERLLEYCDLPTEASVVNSPAENGQEEGPGERNVVKNGKEGRLRRSGEKNVAGPIKRPDAAVASALGAGASAGAGHVTFRDFSMRYSEDTPWRLEGLNLDICPGEKIGVVGRTGAGKSSLLYSLFRLTPSRGSIVLDGVDTGSVPLSTFRKHISVIPQDPLLFSGTIRSNLDPFNTHADADLWRALDLVHLRTPVEAMGQGLGSKVAEDGGNLSLGQRQLVCLARAMLRPTALLVMDEATSNVDAATDALIQETIRTEFKHHSVLVIAHRLDTVIDSDRIAVMEAGRLVEVGPPAELAAKEDGIFASLVREAELRKRRRRRRPSSQAEVSK